MTSVHHGSCLCSAVCFEATVPLRDVFVCHCTQCRAWSGHCWAATSVSLDRFRLTEDRGLAWFRATDRAQRGFCRDCGSSLFWKPDGEYRMSFSPAALDEPTGLHVTHHWHRDSAGDYYSPEGPPPRARGPSPSGLDCACLCGGVAFHLPGPAGDVTACHCTQCRKLSGHYTASFDVPENSVVYSANAPLAIFETPRRGTRGFCADCGSSLWFRDPEGTFSVEAGCVNGSTGGRLVGHMFVGDKGDYYVIDDGLPQHQGWN